MRHKLSMSLAFCARVRSFVRSCVPVWPVGGAAPFAGAAPTCLLALCLVACAPKLGDNCERPAECSVNGDRVCDTSQPGGYCTIPNCAADTCPDDGVCVRFQPDEPRLARSWCMAECGNTRDCDRDRYVCRTATQINNEFAEMYEAGAGMSQAAKIAVVLDSNPNRKFCVVNNED